jgi:poly(3-hydroxybutyrate) depolymerase
MLCERPDLVDGILSLAGIDANAVCKESGYQHHRLIQVHGSADTVIPVAGGRFRDLVSFPSVDKMLGKWEKRFACKATDEKPRHYSIGFAKDESTLKSYHCKNDNGMTLVSIKEGSHIPLINDNFRDEMLDLLFRHD